MSPDRRHARAGQYSLRRAGRFSGHAMSEAGFETITQSAELIEARAADWLMRQRDCDGWNAGDQAALDAWLAQSPAHLIAYARLNSAWAYADRLAALRNSPADVK